MTDAMKRMAIAYVKKKGMEYAVNKGWIKDKPSSGRKFGNAAKGAYKGFSKGSSDATRAKTNIRRGVRGYGKKRRK